MIIEITDFADERLDIYARLSEPQLVHFYEPELGLFIAESPNVIERALNAGYEAVSMLVETKRIEGDAKKVIDRCPDIPIFTAKLEVMIRLTGYQMTRGVLCAMRRRPYPSVREILKDAGRIVVLEDIVNPTNVGAIFRSAAALNIDAVLLTAPCSDPLYRRSARVSMGTVFQIPWTYFDEETDTPEKRQKLLAELGFKTAAMALCEDSVSIDDQALLNEKKLAVILGTESMGLQKETIRGADYTVMIPMTHGVDSLNVAAAAAVAFWELGKRT